MSEVPIECEDHLDRMRLHSQELPIINEQSHSELKQPTVNSSFLFGSHSNISPNIEYHNHSLSIQHQDLLNKGLETETKGNRQKSEIQREIKQEYSARKLKVSNSEARLAYKFIFQLMQSAYIYKESLLNSFQKQFLTETYLLEKEQEIHPNLLKLEIWNLTYSILSIPILIWLPLQFGFQLQKYYAINGVILILIIIDLLITTKKQIFERKFLFQTTLSILQLISFLEIFFENLHVLIQVIFLGLQLFVILKKLKEKFDYLQNYLDFDPSKYLLIGQLLFLNHVCSCFWHLIGLQEVESWITAMEIENSDNFTRYCYSIYWSTATLLNIGQGNIILFTNIELLYSAFIMFLSFLILMKIYSNLQGYKDSKKEQKLKKKLFALNDFFKRRAISLIIKAKIRHHFRVTFQEYNESMINNEKLLSELPIQLKDELLFDMRIHAIKQCTTFDKFSLKSKQNLPKLMELISYEPNQILNEKSIYIIESGIVEMRIHQKAFKQLLPGDSFGQYQFFAGIDDDMKYITIKHTTVFQIKKDEFINLIKENKNDYEIYEFLSHSLLNNSLAEINECCLSCGSKSHLVNNCHILHYKPDIQRLLQKSKKLKQERVRYDRNWHIDHRLNNQVFNRLEINIDALNQLKIKLNIYTVEETSENDQLEGDFLETNINSSTDPIFSNISVNRTKEYIKDGTTISMFKDQVLETQQQGQVSEEWNDDHLLIKSSQGMLNSGGARNEIEQQQLTLQKQQAIFKTGQKVQEQKHKRNSQQDLKRHNSQLLQDQHSSSNVLSDGPLHSQSKIKHKNESQKKIQSQTQIEKGKKHNLNEIKEEDPNSLIVSNKLSEDSQSAQFLMSQIRTHPQRNTLVKSSNKTSKLSAIQLLNSGTITNCRSLINPILTNNHFSFPFENGLVDISMYKNFDQDDDFEVMCNYTVYFPKWNCSSVLRKISSRIK